jgi:hypothetical protein
MERLAEYMHDLARLLGEPESVHFSRLEAGSTALVHRIEYEAIPKVISRVDGIKAGIAPPDALKAQRDLDRKLANDNADGEWTDRNGARIFYLPGARAEKIPEFGAVEQQTVLEGVVRRVGGKAEKVVSVMLQTHEGFETHCQATREMGRILAQHYDRNPLRLSGRGKWLRTSTGWHLERFMISTFEEMDPRGLPEVVADLRSGVYPHLKSIKDPIAALKEIRGDDGE